VLKSARSIVAFALSVIYFTGQVALGSAAETNFWAERRRASGVPQKHAQLVALPSMAPTISQRTLLSELPSLKTIPLSETATWSAHLSPPLKDVVNAIPATYGNIQDIFDGGSREHSPVILVQDVHLNTEAQTNIASLLQDLIDQKKVGLVGVEGAFSAFDFTPFHKSSNRQLIADFLQKNLISAPTYVGIMNASVPPFIGVDDQRHYNANLEALFTAREQKAQAQQRVLALGEQIAAAKKISFSEELKQLDDLRTAYREGKVGFGSYLKNLAARSNENDLVVEQFLNAFDMESQLDFSRIESERKSVLEKLTKALNKKETADLLSLSLAYRTGRVGFGPYYQTLKNLCESKGVRLSATPHFEDYIRYVLLSDGINADKLFDAADRLEQNVFAAAATDKEKTLLAQSDYLSLVGKLLDFSLTAKEWDTYKRQKLEIGNFPLPSLSPFENFYIEADARSERMLQNLTAHPSDGAKVLVLGGFHSPQVAKRLRESKISYVIVSPKLTKIDQSSGSAYLSVFAREKTPLEKLFSGEKLFINPAKIAAVASVGSFTPVRDESLPHVVRQMRAAAATEKQLGVTRSVWRTWNSPRALVSKAIQAVHKITLRNTVKLERSNAEFLKKMTAEDRRLMEEIIATPRAQQNELLAQHAGKIIASPFDLKDDRTRSSTADTEGRTLYLRLDYPIEINGRSIRVLRLKGVRADQRVELYSKQGKGFAPRKIFLGQDGSIDVKINSIATDPSFLGASLAESAEEEYAVTSQLYELGNNVDMPVAWGRYRRKDRQAPNDPKTVFGFSVFGMEEDDQRFIFKGAEIRDDDSVDEASAFSVVAVNFITGEKKIYGYEQRPTFVAEFLTSIGREMRRNDDAGYPHPFLHLGNIGVTHSGTVPVFRDWEDTLPNDATQTKKFNVVNRLRALSRVSDSVNNARALKTWDGDEERISGAMFVPDVFRGYFHDRNLTHQQLQQLQFEISRLNAAIYDEYIPHFEVRLTWDNLENLCPLLLKLLGETTPRVKRADFSNKIALSAASILGMASAYFFGSVWAGIGTAAVVGFGVPTINVRSSLTSSKYLSAAITWLVAFSTGIALICVDLELALHLPLGPAAVLPGAVVIGLLLGGVTQGIFFTITNRALAAPAARRKPVIRKILFGGFLSTWLLLLTVVSSPLGYVRSFTVNGTTVYCNRNADPGNVERIKKVLAAFPEKLPRWGFVNVDAGNYDGGTYRSADFLHGIAGDGFFMFISDPKYIGHEAMHGAVVDSPFLAEFKQLWERNNPTIPWEKSTNPEECWVTNKQELYNDANSFLDVRDGLQVITPRMLQLVLLDVAQKNNGSVPVYINGTLTSRLSINAAESADTILEKLRNEARARAVGLSADQLRAREQQISAFLLRNQDRLDPKSTISAQLNDLPARFQTLETALSQVGEIGVDWPLNIFLTQRELAIDLVTVQTAERRGTPTAQEIISTMPLIPIYGLHGEISAEKISAIRQPLEEWLSQPGNEFAPKRESVTELVARLGDDMGTIYIWRGVGHEPSADEVRAIRERMNNAKNMIKTLNETPANAGTSVPLASVFGAAIPLVLLHGKKSTSRRRQADEESAWREKMDVAIPVLESLQNPDVLGVFLNSSLFPRTQDFDDFLKARAAESSGRTSRLSANQTQRPASFQTVSKTLQEVISAFNNSNDPQARLESAIALTILIKERDAAGTPLDKSTVHLDLTALKQSLPYHYADSDLETLKVLRDAGLISLQRDFKSGLLYLTQMADKLSEHDSEPLSRIWTAKILKFMAEEDLLDKHFRPDISALIEQLASLDRLAGVQSAQALKILSEAGLISRDDLFIPESLIRNEFDLASPSLKLRFAEYEALRRLPKKWANLFRHSVFSAAVMETMSYARLEKLFDDTIAGKTNISDVMSLVRRTTTRLSRIEFINGGNADADYQDFARELLMSTPPTTQTSTDGFPQLTALRDVVVAKDSLDLGDGRTLKINAPSHQYGRTLAYNLPDNRTVHLKLLKKDEDAAALAYEHDVYNFLNSQKDWGLESAYPVGLVRSVKIPVNELEDHLASSDADGNKIEIDRTGGYFTAMVYETRRNGDQTNPYLVYLNDPDLPENEFLRALQTNVHDRMVMARHGLVDLETIELFHNKVGQRRYDWMIDMWRFFNTRDHHQLHRRGAGRFNDFIGATAFPNFRLSGAADLTELKSIRDLVNDPRYRDLAEHRIARIFDMAGNDPSTAAPFVAMAFIGDMMLGLALMAPTYLLRKGKLSYQEETDHTDTLLQRSLAAIFKEAAQAYSGAEENAPRYLNFQLMARQMAYFMTSQYMRDFKAGRPVPADLFPGAKVEQIVKGEGFDDNRGWDIMGLQHLSPTRNNALNLKWKMRSADLGPVNGPNPLQELIRSLYLFWPEQLAAAKPLATPQPRGAISLLWEQLMRKIIFPLLAGATPSAFKKYFSPSHWAYNRAWAPVTENFAVITAQLILMATGIDAWHAGLWAWGVFVAIHVLEYVYLWASWGVARMQGSARAPPSFPINVVLSLLLAGCSLSLGMDNFGLYALKSTITHAFVNSVGALFTERIELTTDDVVELYNMLPERDHRRYLWLLFQRARIYKGVESEPSGFALHEALKNAIDAQILFQKTIDPLLAMDAAHAAAKISLAVLLNPFSRDITIQIRNKGRVQISPEALASMTQILEAVLSLSPHGNIVPSRKIFQNQDYLRYKKNIFQILRSAGFEVNPDDEIWLRPQKAALVQESRKNFEATLKQLREGSFDANLVMMDGFSTKLANFINSYFCLWIPQRNELGEIIGYTSSFPMFPDILRNSGTGLASVARDVQSAHLGFTLKTVRNTTIATINIPGQFIKNTISSNQKNFGSSFRPHAEATGERLTAKFAEPRVIEFLRSVFQKILPLSFWSPFRPSEARLREIALRNAVRHATRELQTDDFKNHLKSEIVRINEIFISRPSIRANDLKKNPSKLTAFLIDRLKHAHEIMGQEVRNRIGTPTLTVYPASGSDIGTALELGADHILTIDDNDLLEMKDSPRGSFHHVALDRLGGNFQSTDRLKDLDTYGGELALLGVDPETIHVAGYSVNHAKNPQKTWIASLTTFTYKNRTIQHFHITTVLPTAFKPDLPRDREIEALLRKLISNSDANRQNRAMASMIRAFT
jgi:hypothetical protein